MKILGGIVDFRGGYVHEQREIVIWGTAGLLEGEQFTTTASCVIQDTFVSITKITTIPLFFHRSITTSGLWSMLWEFWAGLLF